MIHLQPEQTPKRPTDSDDEDKEDTQPIIKKSKTSDYPSSSDSLNRLIKADLGEITEEERLNIIQFVDNEDVEVSHELNIKIHRLNICAKPKSFSG